MERIPQQLKRFMPEWLTELDFQHSPPRIQQDYLTRAQELLDAELLEEANFQAANEALVPEEYFDDNYVYTEFDPLVGDDLLPEFVSPPRPQRPDGRYRGHPDGLLDLIENQLSQGFQVRFEGTRKYQGETPKAFKATFYNMFHLKRLQFNNVNTDEDDMLFEGFFTITPAERPTSFTAPRQHRRSRIGQGKEQFDLDEYDDEFVYIPPSGYCFARILAYLYGFEMQEQYSRFALLEGIHQDRFPQCKIQRFNEFAGTKIGLYDEKKQHVRLCKNYEHVVTIYDGHYVLLKQKGKFAYGYRIAKEKIVWTAKEITQEMLDDVKVVKPPPNKDFNMFADTFVWDCETHPDLTPITNPVSGEITATHDSVPYGAAYLPMSALAPVSHILDSLATVSPSEIEQVIRVKSKHTKVFNSIQHMINSIAAKYRANPPNERNSKGRLQSKNIYFYAHNGSKFDNYLLMIQKFVSFKDILITGRGLVRLKTRHFLRKEDHVIKTGRRKGEIRSHYQFLYINWCCSMSFMQGSLSNLCTSYKLPIELCKSEMDHDAVTAETAESMRPIWVPYLKQDVLSTAICKYLYDRSVYENLATPLDGHGNYNGLPLNDCISNSSLAWRAFLAMHHKNDLPIPEDGQVPETNAEPIFVFQDPNIEKFIRKCVFGGRVGAFKNKFEIEGWFQLQAYLLAAFNVDSMSEIVEKVDRIKSEIKDEWKSSEKYRTVSYDRYYSTEFQRLHPEKAAFMKEFIKNKELLMACDATSLYPSVQVLEDQWPRADTARLMTQEEKQSVMDKLNSGTFSPKLGCFEATIETPRTCFMTACAHRTEHGNVLTVGTKRVEYCSVDIEEDVKCCSSRVTDIHFGIIFDENYKSAIFRPFVLDQFEQRQRAKAAGNDVAQCSIKQCMCSLYGKQVQKAILETWIIEPTRASLERNYDRKYKEVVPLANGSFACKVTVEKPKYMPSYMGVVQLAYSRRLMNRFIAVIDGFTGKVVYYMDTDSLYITSTAYAKLRAAGNIGSAMGQCKNDYGDGGIVFGLFIANKVKFCMTITEDGVPDFHKTFKGHDNQTGLSYDDYERMINGESLTDVSSRWERSLTRGVTIKENNMEKKFDAKVNFLRRQEPDAEGWMAPIGYTL